MTNKRNILLLLTGLFFGCVYYNTFYNAEQSFKQAIRIIDESPQGEDEIPANAKKLLSAAIEKSNLVLDKYPESKYVDDAFYIIGKASFIRGEIGVAERYFKRLLNEFPNSPFVSECEIWLAYAHFKLGDDESAQAEIHNLLENQPKKEADKFLVYKIMGEIKLDQDSIHQAFKYFEEAVNYADNDSKRSSIYMRLVLLGESRGDYQLIIPYLEQVGIYAPTYEIREEAKLKWLKYNRMAGNYDIVSTELENMLAADEYHPIYLQLELEKAKVSLDRKDYTNARMELEAILENSSYKKKLETAEACFHLGYMLLSTEFDLNLAVTYFDSVSRIYRRSTFKKRANDLTKKILKYEDLETDFITARRDYSEDEQTGDIDEAAQFDSTAADSIHTIPSDSIKVIDPTDSEQIDQALPNPDELFPDSGKLQQGLENLPPGMDELPPDRGEIPPGFDGLLSGIDGQLQNDFEPPQQKEKKLGAPDSLLFTMAEMLLFEFQQSELSLEKFKLLIEDFPDSKFVPQSLYILSEFSDDEDNPWRKRLHEDFPDSKYSTGQQDKGAIIEFDPVEKKRAQAWLKLNTSPDSALIAFKKIYELHHDPISAYTVAFINDEYLHQLDATIESYTTFVDSFPSHELATDANSRLTELQNIVTELHSMVVGWVPVFYDNLLISIIPDSLPALMVTTSNDTLLLTAAEDSLIAVFPDSNFVMMADSDFVSVSFQQDSINSISKYPSLQIYSADSTFFAIGLDDTIFFDSAKDSLKLKNSKTTLSFYADNDFLKTRIYDKTPIYSDDNFGDALVFLQSDKDILPDSSINIAGTAPIDSTEVVEIIADAIAEIDPGDGTPVNETISQMKSEPVELMASLIDSIADQDQLDEMLMSEPVDLQEETAPEIQKSDTSDFSNIITENSNDRNETIQQLVDSVTTIVEQSDQIINEKAVSDSTIPNPDLIAGDDGDIVVDDIPPPNVDEPDIETDRIAPSDNVDREIDAHHPESESEPENIAPSDIIDYENMSESEKMPLVIENNFKAVDSIIVDYLVKPGDVLTSIAKSEYGDYTNWELIYQWNIDRIGANPDLIFPYHILKLEKRTQDHVQQSVEYDLYLVLEGETLWTIAEKLFADSRVWTLLFFDNEEQITEQNGKLRPGMELKIRKNLE